MKRVALIGAAVLVLFVGGIATVLVLQNDRAGSGPQLEVLAEDGAVDHDYVIPPGTQDRIRRGEQIAIVPQVLDVEVGESIRIRNDDDAGAFVGIFYVGAGEVVRMRFTTPGELTGVCDVHPSGEFTINVTDV